MTFHVLILCTGNSARSIMAEAILDRLGQGRIQAHSAGSHPKGEPHPEALALLSSLDYDTSGLRSKSWDEFAAPGAPKIDIVITVCDSAAGESCPYWPGSPIKAHWGIADPAAETRSAELQRAAFRSAYDRLYARFEALAALPLSSMSRHEIETALQAIARYEGATPLAREGATSE